MSQQPPQWLQQIPSRKKKKNERWVDFSVQPARTTGGRLNDYVTSRSGIPKNNNHRLGRILWPSKIKGEWERDRLGGGTDVMEIVGGCVSLTVLQSELSWATSSGIHTSSLWVDRERDKLPACPSRMWHVNQRAKVSTPDDNTSSQHTVLHLWGPKKNLVCAVTCKGLTGSRLSLMQIVREIRLPVRLVVDRSHRSPPPIWERQEQGMTAVTLVPMSEIVTMTWVHSVSVINTKREPVSASLWLELML